MMQLRTCSSCGAEKPSDATHFVPAKGCRDGLSRTCRSCRSAYHREWKKQNKERTAPRRRQLYAERHSIAQAKKRQQVIERSPLMARARILRAGMRTRSKALGLPFDDTILTTEWVRSILTTQPLCACCGRELDIGYKFDGKINNNSPSIDRLVPSLGYVEENIALICWRCNNLKRDASSQELETIARWMRLRGL